MAAICRQNRGQGRSYMIRDGRKQKLRKFAVAACLLLPLSAAAAADVSTLSLEDLLQVEIISASKFTQKASEAPSAVRVVTAEDIRLHGWTTLKEALASLPGLYANDDRVYGFLGGRGLLKPGDLNTRFLLLMDGEPLNDNIYEQAFFGDEFPLDLALVESIEYAPGPGSSIYGANAMFGVINVITKKAEALGRGEVAARLDTQGRTSLRATLARPLGEGALTLSWTGLQQAGKDLFYPDAAALGVLTRDGTPTLDGIAHGLDRTRNDKLFARYAQGGFTLSLLAMDRTRRPSSAPYASLFDDGAISARDAVTILSARYDANLAAGIDFSGRLSHGSVTYDAVLPYWDGAARQLWQDRGEGRRWAGEARLLFNRWTGHTLIAGLEFRHDVQARQKTTVGDSTLDFDNDTPDRRQAVYAQDEWRFAPDWRLNAGLRLDQSNRYGNHVSPRLGLIWQARPDATFKLLAGRAFRNPNAYESAYGLDPAAAPGTGAYLANPNLKAEVITTREAVAEWRLTPKSLFTASLFEYRLDAMLSQDATPGGDFQFRNVDPIHARGLETALRTRVMAGWRLDASLSLQEAQWPDGSRVANSPRWIGKLALVGPLAGEALKGAFELSAIGPRDFSWQGSAYHLPAAPIANLALTAGRLAPGLELQLRVTNLFDRHYSWPASDDSMVPRVPGDERTFALAVRYAL